MISYMLMCSTCISVLYYISMKIVKMQESFVKHPEVSLCCLHYHSLTSVITHYTYHLHTSSTAVYSMYSFLFSNILYRSMVTLLTANLNQNYMILTVDWFWHIITVIVFLFLPSWRWPHDWLKHVVGYHIIKLHSHINVHLLVFLKILYIWLMHGTWNI
jgi:hypothetical protein